MHSFRSAPPLPGREPGEGARSCWTWPGIANEKSPQGECTFPACRSAADWPPSSNTQRSCCWSSSSGERGHLLLGLHLVLTMPLHTHITYHTGQVYSSQTPFFNPLCNEGRSIENMLLFLMVAMGKMPERTLASGKSKRENRVKTPLAVFGLRALLKSPKAEFFLLFILDFLCK